MDKSSAGFVRYLSEVGAEDVALVGGECVSLGELFRSPVPKGVRAVDGLATTRQQKRKRRTEKRRREIRVRRRTTHRTEKLVWPQMR